MAAKCLLPLAFASLGASLATPEVAPRSNDKVVSFNLERVAVPEPILKRDPGVKMVGMYNFSNMGHLIELGIGSDGQLVKVLFDTGSQELWVDPSCDDITSTYYRNLCDSNGFYDPSTSTTALSTDESGTILYGIGNVTYDLWTDNIVIPNTSVKIKSANFGVASVSARQWAGTLGVSFGNGYDLKHDSFLDSMVNQGIIPGRQFSVALGQIDTAEDGVVVFGGLDTRKWTGTLSSVPMTHSTGQLWALTTNLDTLTLHTCDKDVEILSINDISTINVLIDSGTTLGSLPTEILDSIAEEMNATYVEETGYYHVDCALDQDKDSNLEFGFGNATVKVPYSELVWGNWVDGSDDTPCIIGLQRNTNPYRPSILGNTFMRSAYVVFDVDNKAISFAQYANCGSNTVQIDPTWLEGGDLLGECF